MPTVAVIQARMASARLPGKVLADLAGRPVLTRVIERLQCASTIDDIVVATTTNEADDVVKDVAAQADARWYRGDEHDVLGRYVGAAVECAAEVVVRITADCPLLDPAVVNSVVNGLTEGREDYDLSCNTSIRTYPRGLCTQASFRDVLERIDRMATSPEEREHIFLFATHSRPELFRQHDIIAADNDSKIRLTLDYPEDLDVIRSVYDALGLGNEIRPYQDVVRWLRSHPKVMRRNQHLKTWNPGDRPI